MLFLVVSPRFCFCFQVLAKRLAGKSVPKITYFVSSGTLNLNSIHQSPYCVESIPLNCYHFYLHYALLAHVLSMALYLFVFLNIYHMPVWYRNGCMDWSGFLACSFPSTYLTVFLKEIGVSQKMRVCRSGSFFPKLWT